MAAKRVYDDPRWKDVRKRVLERDGHRCQIAGPKCRGTATHVDHIVSLADGGPKFDPGNLRASCASCNIARRNVELAERARGVRAGTESGSRRWVDWTAEEMKADCGFDWPLANRSRS